MNRIVFDEIKDSVRKIELERLHEEFARLEQKEGYIDKKFIFSGTVLPYFKLLLYLTAGIGVGLVSIMLNYMIFVWILHITG